ncbi:hypothetical protein [Methyloversatilis discipulorum]|uniref:hypothetical protein n=1 Tax=Methyloversatilis discipulorum TaxID=1119528 RepID=UPI0003700811|nr:hypothetical protein [Methyloversatilis discipulorum]
MPVRPFNDALRKIRRGGLADELSEELNRLTKACTETGRAGELVMKLKLKPGKGGHIEVFDDVTVRMPKPERGVSIFFATPDGNLQTNDPRQGELEGIRSVDAEPEKTVRDVRAAG